MWVSLDPPVQYPIFSLSQCMMKGWVKYSKFNKSSFNIYVNSFLASCLKQNRIPPLLLKVHLLRVFHLML